MFVVRGSTGSCGVGFCKSRDAYKAYQVYPGSLLFKIAGRYSLSCPRIFPIPLPWKTCKKSCLFTRCARWTTRQRTVTCRSSVARSWTTGVAGTCCVLRSCTNPTSIPTTRTRFNNMSNPSPSASPSSLHDISRKQLAGSHVRSLRWVLCCCC